MYGPIHMFHMFTSLEKKNQSINSISTKFSFLLRYFRTSGFKLCLSMHLSESTCNSISILYLYLNYQYEHRSYMLCNDER